MKFGVREICDVVFKATDTVRLGDTTFVAGQPVLYIDTAKTSSLAGAATTVYATGGKGNTRLLAWEGEKTLTFTVEDAMLSPLGFSVLTGAGLLEAGSTEVPTVNVHTNVELMAASVTTVTITGADLDLIDGATTNIYKDVNNPVPVYGTVVDASGAFVRSLGEGTVTTTAVTRARTASPGKTAVTAASVTVTFTGAGLVTGKTRVLLDFYVVRTGKVSEMQITADKFAGYYYVEASTLFRDQETGTDLPAEIVLPKVKIQSNFTFAMAATGDPSTFSFVMDAFPAPTKFSTDKVLCAIQIVGEGEAAPAT